MATQPQAVENETNEAVYVKDGLMTWEVLQQALLLISLPLTSALLAVLLVLLVTPQLEDPSRLVPHYQHAYRINAQQCEQLWQQQSLDEFQNCVHQLKVRIIEFAEHYEEIQNEEQVRLDETGIPKVTFLDTTIITQLEKKLDTALDEGEINVAAIEQEQDASYPVSSHNNTPSHDTNAVMSRDNKGIEIATNINNMTDVEEILKWCAVLKSRTVLGSSLMEAPDCYKRVLQLDPNNYMARKSIRSIKVKYTQWAMRALTSAESGKNSLERALNRAKVNIDRVKDIDPDDAVLADLIRRYEELEAQYRVQILDECYDIVDLAVSSKDIGDSDRTFIRQNCPQPVINEVEELVHSKSSFFDDIELDE